MYFFKIAAMLATQIGTPPHMIRPKMNPPCAHFQWEEKLGYHGIAGIDEAGYGCWAGPVAVCAVRLNAEVFPDFLRQHVYDSKKIKPLLRQELHDYFISNPAYGNFAVEMVWPEEIAASNVLHATFQGMQRALLRLEPHPQHVLVDGPRMIKGLPNVMQQHPIIKGDEQSYSIAMASIIAKVQRDHLMNHLHQEYPHYGWNTNKGYGTQAHMHALKQHGFCPYHRTKYRIKALELPPS